MKIYLRTMLVNSFLILLFAGFSFGQTGSKEIITIGDGTTVSNNTPIYPWYGYSFTQTLYFQSELNVADQRITQIGYQYAGSSSPMEVEIEIWLGHSTLNELTSSVPLTSFTKVYDGEWACSAGDEFSIVPVTPWVYNNTDNLIITVIEKKPGWNSSSDAFYSTASPAGQTLSVGYEDDNNPMDPNNLPAGSARFFRPNTRIWTDDIPSGPAVSQITPTTLAFGVTPLVQGSVLNVQVKNTGAEPLEITGFSSSNDQFSLINTSFPFTLNGGASQDVEIQFMPLDTDPQSGTITFLMDAAIAGDRDVQVSGTGISIETLIVGTDTYANNNTPFYPYYGYSFTQTIYLQSELNTGVKMIDKIGYQYSGPSSSLNVDIEVYMGHTDLTSLSESIPLGSFTKVYDGPWECVSEEGFSEIDITPFFYNNSDNLIVSFIEKQPGWNSSSDKFLSTSSGAEIMCVGYQDDNNPMDPNDLPTGNPISYRANTKFWLIDPSTGPAISQITPLSLDFESIQVGLSGTMNVVIENTGADPLEITGANISSGQFSLGSTSFPFTLFASASKTIEVTFSPTSVGVQSGVITFLMDAAIAGDREVQLAGEGIPFTSLIIGDGTYAYNRTPVYPQRAYSFTQTIYLQEELNFSNKAITKIGYQYGGSNANLEQEIEVWLGHTTESYTPWSLPLTGSVKVYDGPWVCHSGEEWSSFDISQFPYNNTDNLLITVIEKDPSTYSSSDTYYTYSVPQGTSVGAYSSSTPYDPNNLPNAISLSYKANIKLWVNDVATGPAISQITPTSLNFGELEFGQTSTMGVVIKNTGIDPLEITGFSSTNGQFSVINTSFPLTLNSNLQQTVDIKFTPTTTELETGTITFEMDAAIEGDKQVEVSGQMLPIPPVVITEFPWIEGFDGGVLPDGWQNVVNEGNGFEFSTTPFSHTFIYYFGDLQRNAQLVTPLLDLNGLNPVKLGINHRIYAYETGWSHKILISEDGVNWDILAEYTEGFNPDDYQYDEFDVTPSKAGEQVYIAFAVDYPFLPEYYEVVWEIESVTVFEPIPVFDVSFVVEDDGGNPLTDAVVTFNGVSNPAGDYLFEEMEAGTYDYTVELDGYLTAEGQVEVVDEDVEETVVLSPPVVISEFPWFEGFDGGALPLGWQNVVNEGNGFNFALGPYSHTYIYYFGDLQRHAMLVSPLLDLSGMETVTLGVYHRIYAYGTGWYNKILISNDGVNWETVAEFTEGFNPDVNQYMEFDITPSKAGEQVYLAFEVNYPFLAEYYETVWEIVDIDVFEPIDAYKVNFIVEDDGGNALNDAVVTLNGVTNAAGDYLFEEIEAGIYDYTVELDGYITAEGQVEVVDQDVEEIVILHVGQSIPLVEGWSFISSYIAPESTMLDQIFAGILQNESMVIMLNKAGIYWPGYNINTIGQWDSYSGYKIKMNSDEMLDILGVMVENKSVSLTAGANYLPVLSNTPIMIEEILTQINDELVFIYDLAGGLMYWPQGGIFTLELLEPGKAYLLNMNAPAQVSYEDLGGEKTFSQNPVIDYPKNLYTKTGTVHLISIAGEALEGIIEPGDYMGAFTTKGQCVGAVKYINPKEALGLTVYGEDITEESNGLKEGENIELKIIKNKTQELINLMPVWNSAMPDASSFVQNGQSGVSELKMGSLSIEDSDAFDLSIYPNPASSMLTIALSGSQTASINICDQLGQVVWKGQVSQGSNNVNISALSPGIYFVQIADLKQNRHTMKLIKD